MVEVRFLWGVPSSLRLGRNHSYKVAGRVRLPSDDHIRVVQWQYTSLIRTASWFDSTPGYRGWVTEGSSVLVLAAEAVHPLASEVHMDERLLGKE
jgi:hypothetical protein